MYEFQYGDRVRWGDYIGTVVNEADWEIIIGDFNECLPQPVAVLWDSLPMMAYWMPGSRLELIREGSA